MSWFPSTVPEHLISPQVRTMMRKWHHDDLMKAQRAINKRKREGKVEDFKRTSLRTQTVRKDRNKRLAQQKLSTERFFPGLQARYYARKRQYFAKKNWFTSPEVIITLSKKEIDYNRNWLTKHKKWLKNHR